jgi:Plant transposon protein
VLKQLLTLYSEAQIHDAELSPRRDSFNFYQSSLRMRIEQAFGILVSRFGVLWKPMRYPLPMVSRILSSCMRIHNFCIDEDVAPMSEIQDPSFVSATEAAFSTWWHNAEQTRDTETRQGRRTDLEAGSKRDGLARQNR